MTIDLFKRLGWFAFFFIIQVMMLGHMHLFHCATPLFYVYFVLMFPRNHAKWAILVWSFALGLLIDIFLNTPGLAAASLTLLAAIQPYFLELFIYHCIEFFHVIFFDFLKFVPFAVANVERCQLFWVQSFDALDDDVVKIFEGLFRTDFVIPYKTFNLIIKQSEFVYIHGPFFLIVQNTKVTHL